MLYFRQATIEDLPSILQMYKKRVAYNDAHDMHQWSYEEVTWRAFSQLYKIEDYQVGILDGVIVCGMFVVDVDTIYWPQEPKGVALYIHKVCVDPDYKGLGFGKLLLDRFKELGKQYPVSSVRLDVKKHKDKLQKFYEENGFVFVREGQFVPDTKTYLYEYKLENRCE